MASQISDNSWAIEIINSLKRARDNSKQIAIPANQDDAERANKDIKTLANRLCILVNLAKNKGRLNLSAASIGPASPEEKDQELYDAYWASATHTYRIALEATPAKVLSFLKHLQAEELITPFLISLIKRRVRRRIIEKSSIPIVPPRAETDRAPLSKSNLFGLIEALQILRRVVERTEPFIDWIPSAFEEMREPKYLLERLRPTDRKWIIIIACDFVKHRLMPSGVTSLEDHDDIINSDLKNDQKIKLNDLRQRLFSFAFSNRLANEKSFALEFVVFLDGLVDSLGETLRCEKPIWKKSSRELWLHNQRIASFGGQAKRVTKILDKFEELKWPARIRCDEMTGDILGNAIYQLNQKVSPIFFGRDGTGAVTWKILNQTECDTRIKKSQKRKSKTHSRRSKKKN